MIDRRISRLFVLLVVAVSALAFLAGCGPSTGKSAKQPSESREPALEKTEKKVPSPPKEADKKTDGEGEAAPAVDETEGADAGEKQTVKIAGSTFEPATLTVKAGTTVVWLNTEPAEHKVHDDNDAYLSEAVGKDGTFEMTFSAPGTFTYHCHVHPMMRGTIIVE